jgi:hypothetical protein
MAKTNPVKISNKAIIPGWMFIPYKSVNGKLLWDTDNIVWVKTRREARNIQDFGLRVHVTESFEE